MIISVSPGELQTIRDRPLKPQILVADAPVWSLIIVCKRKPEAHATPLDAGGAANNVWSVAGSGSRPDVNQFLMQNFINYNLQKGWYIPLAPIITANWQASRGNVWTVPFGGGIGRIMKLGPQPVSLQCSVL